MQLMNVNSWSDFKTLITNKMLGASLQYTEGAENYEIYAPELNTFLWHYTLRKAAAGETVVEDSEQDDFETNYKPTANAPLEIKSASGKPTRVVASAQPMGTSESWSGFAIEFGAEDTEKTHYVTFSKTVYLRGGYMLADNVLDGDIMNVTVEMLIDEVWTTIAKPWDNIPLSRINTIVFVSGESLEFPTVMRLAVTVTSVAAAARKYYGVANFFE